MEKVLKVGQLHKLIEKYTLNIVKSCLRGIISVCVNRKIIAMGVWNEFIQPISIFLKNHTLTQYKILIDIIAVDYLSKLKRFEIIYNFLSISRNSRFFLKSNLTLLATINSISLIYPAAVWFEREVWDMFGIFFINNFDLRRILTDYGFDGHPFRKDFPLSGYVEVRYDENQKRILTESLEMAQEYRDFDFL